MTATLTAPANQGAVAPTLIDGDIHTTFASNEVLLKYLPRKWHRHQEQFGAWTNAWSAYPKESPNAARIDAWPPEGGPPGSSLPFLREQLLDEWGIDLAVNNPLVQSQSTRHADYAAALCEAVNEWQLGEWSGSCLLPAARPGWPCRDRAMLTSRWGSNGRVTPDRR